ncbi:MAG: hypothetical protein QF578_20795 [Alphaproteobacteria bacterium]|jgi:hypothetical protein|nr:hypothetical protein [Alphaproteobacteria bacterium]MDP6567280.1 hypothetical protein [Alphaproteobacteria bacterium]MDP6811710.1 hypothetical protein [Alphaproteobacteria bacterium]
MAQEYEAFVRDRQRAVSGREVVLTLRDLTPGRHKYRGIAVRAVISETPLAGEPLLWLRSVVGARDTEPCSVRIVEELPPIFDAPPYSDYFTVLEALEKD